MESAIPVSLATARTDADAAVGQHSKATRNESANAMGLTVSIFRSKAMFRGSWRPGVQGRERPLHHLYGRVMSGGDCASHS